MLCFGKRREGCQKGGHGSSGTREKEEECVAELTAKCRHGAHCSCDGAPPTLLAARTLSHTHIAAHFPRDSREESCGI